MVRTPPTNFANIGNQVAFNNTIKYFQQSLGVLVSMIRNEEKAAVKREFKKFILNDQQLAKKVSEVLKNANNEFSIMYPLEKV